MKNETPLHGLGAADAAAPRSGPSTIETFVALSAVLTGFSPAELWGTGQVRPHWSMLLRIAGERLCGRLLDLGATLPGLASTDRDACVRQAMLDPDLGPLVNNLIVLWYTGLWQQLPQPWRNAHGAHAEDLTGYPSPAAYAQGLVWKAMHVHPQGALQPGFGSWALPPVVQERGHGH